MPIFTKKETTKVTFDTRAEAFSYALQYLTEEKKMDLIEASEKANQFAETFAKNMGIPLKTTPPLSGVDKVMDNITKITTCIEKNPLILEYGVPAVTFLVGLFTGSKVENNEHKEHHTEQNLEPQENFNIEELD